MSSVNKKVFHIINGEFYSGAERVQDLLAQRLPDYGYEVWLACVKPGTFTARCMCDKTRVLEFPMKSRFDWAQAFRIGKYVRSQKFNLIHTHTPRTAILGYIASRVAGVPLVHHLHSPTSRDTEDFFRNKINAFIETFIMKKVDRVIVVSKSLNHYLVHLGVDQKKIDVVLNGVPSLPHLTEREAPHGTWVIGTLALFRPRKGLEILLQALAILHKNKIPVRLNAVGEFESEQYKQEIYTLANKLGLSDIIDWVGFVQDIEREFSRIDIFVLPSLFGEGLPMVVLEAMANGVPVISTRVEGVPEAIINDSFGYIVAPDNEEQIANAIESLINNPNDWKSIRENAYNRQVDLLSAKAMARGVASVYDNL